MEHSRPALFPKSVSASSFAFEETNSAAGQFVRCMFTRRRMEFILVQENELQVKLDGK